MADDSAMPPDWLPPAFDEARHASWKVLRRLRRRSLDSFLASAADPEEAQRAAAARVLDSLTGTAFAKEHGLAGARTLQDLRSAVPVRPAQDYQPWLDRVVAGEACVLSRHPVLSFVKTSGTTGEPRLLPVTRPWARTVAEAQAVWVMAMLAEQPTLGAVGARDLTLTGPAREGGLPSGLGFGSNTGRMGAAQPWWVQLRFAVPRFVSEIEDATLRHYVVLRLALPVDVRSWTTANPSTILALCRAMASHREALSADLVDGTLVHGPAAALDPGLRRRLRPWIWRRRSLPEDWRPAAFWPHLACINCWKGGAAPFFVARLGQAVGREVPVREVGVSASEGHVAVPLHSSWWGGVVHAGGHLVELLAEDGGDCVLPHQARVGATYRLVLSTTAGLTRYDLGDRVVCEGSWRRSPLIRFVGRAGDVSSVTGEKITGWQVAEAARRVLGPAAIGFFVGVRLAEVSTYVFAVEGGGRVGPDAELDAALCELNGEYASKRRSDRLAPAERASMPPGTLDRWRRWRAKQGAADGQIKEPLLVDGPTLARLLAGWPDDSAAGVGVG